MSRYMKELPVSKTPEEMKTIAERYLQKKRFALQPYADGNMVWQHGRGLVSTPQFIRITPEEGCVRVEAWIKYTLKPGVYSGEVALKGLVGIGAKAVLRKKVSKLEGLLSA